VTSPVGTSPVGTSPVGTSPVGTSPAGTSPAGTSPAGAPAPETVRAGTDAGPRTSASSGPYRGRRLHALLAGLTGLVAVVCALALPFAPVSVNEPTVTWPRDPGRPEPTLLNLTAYRPLALDATFTCAVARQAAASGGTVLATVQPQWPEALAEGLVVTAGGDRLQVHAMDRTLVDEPLTGDCTYTISGTSRGRPEYQGKLPDPLDPAAPDTGALAGPDDAVLTVSRDGTELARATGPLLPSVDLLTTSVTATAPGALAVSLAVDDEFTSSPTPFKRVLVGLLVAMLLATAALLVRLDRGVSRVSRPWRFAKPRVVDVVVPAVILFWMFVAPATDDDGYYAAMARNARISGAVGNYYQLYDQNFTPFTWFYYVLGWWQGVVGDAPVLQRVLAAVFGVLTWVLLRRFAADAMAEIAADRPGVRSACHAVLAAVFLAWWVPQDMGVRPEGLVCVCGAATMYAVLAAARRRRLAVAWLAFALAGLGFAAHPTGFTLLAPLVAGLPLLWRLVAEGAGASPRPASEERTATGSRPFGAEAEGAGASKRAPASEERTATGSRPFGRAPGDRAVTAARALAVASGGMVAPLLAFVDGGLRDFLRGQAIFLSIQPQENWTTEIQRYEFLLTPIAMGNYAKRAAVLLCLVSLVWFAVLAAAARVRRVPLPTALWLAGSTAALAFAALWLTPSKWTHHFGALAGVGSAFLALFLALAVPTARSVLDRQRLSYGVVAAAAASVVVAIALGWHGPNQWPYAWLDGVRRPDFPPAIKRVVLDSPLLWVFLLALVVAALALCSRLVGTRDARLNVLRAVPILAVISLLGTTAYTVGTFGLAAVEGVPRASLWAQGWVDPTAQRCAAAGATEVLDPYTAVPLARAAGAPVPPAPTGFVENAGYYAPNRPQGAAARQVWGSLVVPPEGGSADRTAGEVTTPWYALADRTAGSVTLIAAGSLSDGNTLTVEYGRAQGGTVVPAGSEVLTDEARDPSWRTLTPTPPSGADVMRLVAVDASGGIGGWLAFSAPVAAKPVPLSTFLPPDAPVALAWQAAFAYPCQRQPGMVNGITEAPAFGVGWGDGTALSGMTDAIWQAGRGGAFAQVYRAQSVLQLATVRPVAPNTEVYVFGSDLGRDRYTLTLDRRTVGGASTATGRDALG
jgi:Mycobacterial cell wall arabinan synthesis protein/EmbC C-terminal domain/Arabinosyltransferase concanavalin like domain